jgi:hypothetical protein
MSILSIYRAPRSTAMGFSRNSQAPLLDNVKPKRVVIPVTSFRLLDGNALTIL